MTVARFVALVLAVCLTALLVGPLAASGPEIDRQVLSGGGGPTTGSGVSLNGSVGQFAAGPASAELLSTGSGFWSGYFMLGRYYLPVIVDKKSWVSTGPDEPPNPQVVENP